jgi:hypothetical protein
VYAYVFLALPVRYVCKGMARLFPDAIDSEGTVPESNADQ